MHVRFLCCSERAVLCGAREKLRLQAEGGGGEWE